MTDGSGANEGSGADATAPDGGVSSGDGGSVTSGEGTSGEAHGAARNAARDAADALLPAGGLSRRESIGYAVGLGGGLGGWRALDNVFLGYGILTGTNLYEQDLDAYASERLAVHGTALSAGGYDVRVDDDAVSVLEGDERFASAAVGGSALPDARSVDAEYGLDGSPVAQLVADVAAIRSGEFSFAFSRVGPFFERLRGADVRPYTVGTLRGPVFGGAEAALVADFAGVHPSDPEGLVRGLAEGFREHTSYDVPRYLAGSVEDNVLLGATDLRRHFESPTGYEALVSGENTGLFCTELVARSIEAFHAVPATEQSPPVVSGYVQDSRHKHAYTVLASAVREGGDLVLPVTFVDYTHSTLYDDLRLRWLLGEGVEAYDDRHRTTGIYWNRHGGL